MRQGNNAALGLIFLNPGLWEVVLPDTRKIFVFGEIILNQKKKIGGQIECMGPNFYKFRGF